MFLSFFTQYVIDTCPNDRTIWNIFSNHSIRRDEAPVSYSAVTNYFTTIAKKAVVSNFRSSCFSSICPNQYVWVNYTVVSYSCRWIYYYWEIMWKTNTRSNNRCMREKTIIFITDTQVF